MTVQRGIWFTFVCIFTVYLYCRKLCFYHSWLQATVGRVVTLRSASQTSSLCITYYQVFYAFPQDLFLMAFHLFFLGKTIKCDIS